MPLGGAGSVIRASYASSVAALVSLSLVASGVCAAQDSTATAPATAAATDPRAVQPERPTVATHAYTVAPGYVEIETGAQEARPGGVRQFSAPVVVKIGLAPRLQAELQGGYVSNGALGGIGGATAGTTDLALALKQRVLDGAPIMHDLSLQGAVKLATGARDVGTGTTDVSILLISSRPIGRAELDLNAGYTRRTGTGARAPTSATLLTASFGTPIRGRLGGVAELFALPGTDGPAGSAPMVGFLFGPTLQLRSSLVLDAGAIVNVEHMGANAAYAGLTCNLGRLPGLR